MARDTFPLWAALKTVAGGLSGRAGLRALRAGGGKISDAKWYKAVGEARRMTSEHLIEALRPLNRRPSGDEITKVTSVTKSGYYQQVDIFWRDTETGEIGSSPFILRGDGLVTRQKAVQFAVGEWSAGSSGTPNPNDYEVIGAAYVSTLELSPEG